ncbi:MAG: hypothetical protein KJ893_09130 [Candidatus Omnitrophica bacterium]|nr:hypothetical protein [Candidatus Omnitrophota bacterium]MBU4478262.1 hypothetical protein [Candidatus Omnitrophota bacterium]MCG2703330.1 hypothetical protein [Candidatus Omnitrophota bacterium]
MAAVEQVFRARVSAVKNRLAGIKKHSRLKIFIVWLVFIGLISAAFYVPYRAFLFLESMGSLGLVIVDRLLYLFFMGLFVMLIFSNCIICYSTGYRARETTFFFSLPLEYAQIYFIKFIDSIFLSSWTFLCFLLPILSAYAFVKELEWTFYVFLLVFFVPFAVIAAAIGCLITLLLIRFLPRRFYQVLGWTVSGLFFAGCVWLFLAGRSVSQSENEVSFLLTNFIPHFGFSQFAFAPNFWISEGIMKFIAGLYVESLFWWLLLLSNALFFSYIGIAFARRLYYEGWLRSGSSGTMREFLPQKDIISKFCRGLRFLPLATQALVVKDIKIFWRDPVQWSQFTVFFGLLAIYFANIRNLGYEQVLPFWKNIICFLNLSSTNLTLASLSVRFVFPQISLEGKRFWILGLAPLEKRDILFEKFWFNSIAALCISLPLILLSNSMLSVSPELMWLSVMVVVVMCFSLISLCTGLGALFPNFKEDNPAQIVSGFGGTLTLVLCLLYIAVNVTALALPFHLFITEQITEVLFKKLIVYAAIFIVFLSIITIGVSLSAGTRALKDLEM